MIQNSISSKDLVHKNENKYFWFVAIVSILIYIGTAVSIIGIFIILGMLAVSLFLHALMIGTIRSNAVKLNENQFPEVYEKVKQLCKKMEIRYVPDIYVMESSGTLNAFATRFFGRNMVVLYSEIFELIDRDAEDELSFVIAHELAHIKRKHISKSLFILPAMWLPGIAEMYLRACEYTCDRFAAYYTENPEAGKNALTILAIGKNLYSRVNRFEFMNQLNSEKGFFVWLSEILSTHPPLPKRIHEIGMFFEQGEPVINYKQQAKMAYIWLPIFLISLGLVWAGIDYGIEQFLNSDPLPELESGYETEDVPPIIYAVANGDAQKVQSYIQNGEDINVTDNDSWTPLHWAVKDGNEEIVQLLIDAGAEINSEDTYGMTPLMTAAEKGDTKMVAFLADAGADINYQDYEGMTPLMYAVLSQNTETVELLLNLGADARMTDNLGKNTLMHAIQSGNQEIVQLLKQVK
jgi:Zn-dependent protease with chaperone function